MTSLLAQVVRATSTAADPDELLSRVARLVPLRDPRVDWAIVDRLEEPDLVVRVAGHDARGPLRFPAASGGASARRSSAGSVGLLPRLRRSPQRLLRLDAAALASLVAADEPTLARQAQNALDLGTVELVLLGLVARDRLLGVLTVGSRGPFGGDCLAELADVALHTGTALDAAGLLAAQRAVGMTLQTSLLPPLPSVEGLDLAARYSPATRGLDVGGDWYDAFPTAAGLVVVVGDVRGHDLSAATRMADLRNLLRAHAVDRREPPSALVGRLERTAEALGLEAAATCVVSRLVREGDVWTAQWTSAGHPPPVLLHDGVARLLETEADLMLGVEVGSTRTDHVQRLVPGDLLVLYTDGLVEQRDVPLGERLELLRSRVQAHVGASPDQLAERLLSELAAPGSDDIALLVAQAV